MIRLTLICCVLAVSKIACRSIHVDARPHKVRHWKAKTWRNHPKDHRYKNMNKTVSNPLNDLAGFISLGEKTANAGLVTYHLALSPIKPIYKPWRLALNGPNSFSRQQPVNKRIDKNVIAKLFAPSGASHMRKNSGSLHKGRHSISVNNKNDIVDNIGQLIDVSVDVKNELLSDRPALHLERNSLDAAANSINRPTPHVKLQDDVLSRKKRQAVNGNQPFHVWLDSCQSHSDWFAIGNTTDIRNQVVTVLPTINVVGIPVHQYFFETFCLQSGTPCRGIDSTTISSKCQTKYIWTYAYAMSPATREIGWTQIPIRGSCNCAIRRIQAGSTTP